MSRGAGVGHISTLGSAGQPVIGDNAEKGRGERRCRTGGDRKTVRDGRGAGQRRTGGDRRRRGEGPGRGDAPGTRAKGRKAVFAAEAGRRQGICAGLPERIRRGRRPRQFARRLAAGRKCAREWRFARLPGAESGPRPPLRSYGSLHCPDGRRREFFYGGRNSHFRRVGVKVRA